MWVATMATGRTAAFAAALLACCFAASVRAQTFNEYPTPTNASFPWGITLGPDGNLWFTENHASKIGRITPAGAISEFNLPTGGGDPYDIVTGPDGALWFTERSANKIGRITT